MPPTSNLQLPKKNHTTLVIVILSAALAVMTGLFIWGVTNYIAQKTDVDNKVDERVAVIKKEQADSYAADLIAHDKKPNKTLFADDDFGHLNFKYPKTWSVYVSEDVTTGGTYEAYLNPGSVPPVVSSQRFALRVTIESKDYDKVVASYGSLVSKGELKSSAVVENGNNGARLDGNFSKDIRGAAVIFKIRDKTATIRTDANTFMPDFEKLIKTINFNQ